MTRVRTRRLRRGVDKWEVLLAVHRKLGPGKYVTAIEFAEMAAELCELNFNTIYSYITALPRRERKLLHMRRHGGRSPA